MRRLTPENGPTITVCTSQLFLRRNRWRPTGRRKTYAGAIARADASDRTQESVQYQLIRKSRFFANFTLAPLVFLGDARQRRANGTGMVPFQNLFQQPAACNLFPRMADAISP